MREAREEVIDGIKRKGRKDGIRGMEEILGEAKENRKKMVFENEVEKLKEKIQIN